MRQVIEKEIQKVDASFSKIEGFLEAAICEINPPHAPYGPIESMFVYTPPAEDRLREVRLIRDELSDILDSLKSTIKSLASMNEDMKHMYLVEVEKNKKDYE
jgi:hypothetical protein